MGQNITGFSAEQMNAISPFDLFIKHLPLELSTKIADIHQAEDDRLAAIQQEQRYFLDELVDDFEGNIMMCHRNLTTGEQFPLTPSIIRGPPTAVEW